MDGEKRPVQIQLEEEVYRILRVYGATVGKSGNEVIADLARNESERVRELVAPVMR